MLKVWSFEFEKRKYLNTSDSPLKSFIDQLTPCKSHRENADLKLNWNSVMFLVRLSFFLSWSHNCEMCYISSMSRSMLLVWNFWMKWRYIRFVENKMSALISLLEWKQQYMDGFKSWEKWNCWFREAKSNTEKVVFIYFTIVAYSMFSGIERAYRPRIYNPNYYFSDF